MADRIVDEMNPNTPFKSKDVSSFLVLQHDLLEKLPYIKCDLNIDQFPDPVMQNVLKRAGDKITQVTKIKYAYIYFIILGTIYPGLLCMLLVELQHFILIFHFRHRLNTNPC